MKRVITLLLFFPCLLTMQQAFTGIGASRPVFIHPHQGERIFSSAYQQELDKRYSQFLSPRNQRAILNFSGLSINDTSLIDFIHDVPEAITQATEILLLSHNDLAGIPLFTKELFPNLREVRLIGNEDLSTHNQATEIIMHLQKTQQIIVLDQHQKRVCESLCQAKQQLQASSRFVITPSVFLLAICCNSCQSCCSCCAPCCTNCGCQCCVDNCCCKPYTPLIPVF